MKTKRISLYLLSAVAALAQSGTTTPSTEALRDWKLNCRVATTAQITLATALNAGDTVDGTTLAANDRVLVKDQTDTAQVETATVLGTVTGNGNARLVLTSAGMSGSPLTIDFAVLDTDTATQVATKARTALNANGTVTTRFTIGGTGADLVLTRTAAALNDTTLNLSVANSTSTGLTAAPTSANTTAGALGTENGIWVVGVTPRRATDADTWLELPGSKVGVTDGTLNRGTEWRNSSSTTGTIDTTAITYAPSNGAAGSVSVVSESGTVTNYSPTANSSSARGVSLTAALAAATSGQTVKTGPGTYTFTTNVAMADGVTLDMDPGTVISSAVSDMSGVVAPILTPGTNSIVRGGKIIGTKTDGEYQAPFGVMGTAKTGWVLEGTVLEADTDGLYVTAAGATGTVRGCTILTKFDAIAVSGAATVINCYNCKLVVTGPTAAGVDISRGIVTTTSGTVRFYGGTIAVTDGGIDINSGVYATGGSTIEIHDVALRCSNGAGSADITNTGTGSPTVCVFGGTGSNADGSFVTSGTITYAAANKIAVTGTLTVATQTPASAAAAGVAGTITWDSSFIYICVATNTWKRVAIATW